MAPQTSWATSGCAQRSPRWPQVVSLASAARRWRPRVVALPSPARLRHDARRCASATAACTRPHRPCRVTHGTLPCAQVVGETLRMPRRRSVGWGRLDRNLQGALTQHDPLRQRLVLRERTPGAQEACARRHRAASSRQKRATAGVGLVLCGALACTCLDTCCCPSERLALGGGQSGPCTPCQEREARGTGAADHGVWA